MHIPNAVLDPKVAITTALAGASGLAYCLGKLDRQLGDRSPVLLGTMAAFVFAAQMVTFPLGPFGVSGHLLGGVLAAVVLGPWAGAVVIAAVLIVQCLVFGDGGLLALGANFVNMGIVGSVIGYAIYDPIRKSIGGQRGVLMGAILAAWASVILASAAFSIELAASGRWSDFSRVLSWMALIHAGIGVGEALITGVVLKFVLQTRPDLIYEPESPIDSVTSPEERLSQAFRIGTAGLAAALTIGVFLAPFASGFPDGLEFVGERLGFLKGAAPASIPVLIPDYEFPGLQRVSLKAATAAAGAVGTCVVFLFGLGLTGLLTRSAPAAAPEKVAADAA